MPRLHHADWAIRSAGSVPGRLARRSMMRLYLVGRGVSRMKQFISKCLLSVLCVAGMLGQSALLMSLPFFSAEAVAQTSASNSEPASREDVQNLFAILKLDRMMQVTMSAAAEQMKTNLPELMKQQNIEIPKEQLDPWQTTFSATTR